MINKLSQFTSTSKINLYLDIIGKDPKDGYHFLESIFYEIPWGDDFEIFSSEHDEVIFKNDENQQIPLINTVSQALQLFKKKFNINDCFSIRITKNVPIGAGLGGGSGNAGALLKWLSNYYQKEVRDCLDIAQKIGSDVPFFLYGGMALVEGKGEKITPLPNKLKLDGQLVIINPGVHVSTKEAFEKIKISEGLNREKLKDKKYLKKLDWDIDNLKEIMYNIFNDNLESTNEKLFSIRNQIFNLLSPDIIMMTGSGSSFIALFKKSVDSVQIKRNTKELYNDCSAIYILSI